MLDTIYDFDTPRECPMCGEYFDNSETLTEVDGYSECLDCLKDDPEILAELKETHPHLFSAETE